MLEYLSLFRTNPKVSTWDFQHNALQNVILFHIMNQRIFQDLKTTITHPVLIYIVIIRHYFIRYMNVGIYSAGSV